MYIHQKYFPLTRELRVPCASVSFFNKGGWPSAPRTHISPYNVNLLLSSFFFLLHGFYCFSRFLFSTILHLSLFLTLRFPLQTDPQICPGEERRGMGDVFTLLLFVRKPLPERFQFPLPLLFSLSLLILRDSFLFKMHSFLTISLNSFHFLSFSRSLSLFNGKTAKKNVLFHHRKLNRQLTFDLS